MPGGIYSALSGLSTQTSRIDRLALDIANSATSGYRGARSSSEVAERDSFANTLASAVDVAPGPAESDFRAGELAPTGRSLDLAIEGPGFFSIETPGGVRYTRNGNFTLGPDGTVTTSDGCPLIGDGGAIRLPPGDFEVSADGTFRVGRTTIGRPVVTTFDDPGQLVRTDGVRFRAPDGVVGRPDDEIGIHSGMLEHSNVQIPERIAQLTQASRSFEALTRGIAVLSNDIDSRAIMELGRKI